VPRLSRLSVLASASALLLALLTSCEEKDSCFLDSAWIFLSGLCFWNYHSSVRSFLMSSIYVLLMYVIYPCSNCAKEDSFGNFL
jgi:hypothetical protein